MENLITKPYLTETIVPNERIHQPSEVLDALDVQAWTIVQESKSTTFIDGSEAIDGDIDEDVDNNEPICRRGEQLFQ
jgi:hypothetical protein